MSKTNIYLGEAYEALQKLSAGDKKRIEYEARDKALKDYNTQINSAERRGQKLGIQLARKVFKLHGQGKSNAEIAAECNITTEYVKEILG